MVQQRNDNGRVFGGWVGLKKFDIGTYTRDSGYLRGNVRGRAWMYRLNPSNKQIEFAEKAHRTHYVYKRSDYHLTWGGGHDYMCRNDGYSYANMDHDYDTPHGYGSGSSRSWLHGSYRYNCKNDLIEIYKTEA